MIGKRQKEILQFCYGKEKVTKKEIVSEFGGWYYCSKSQNIGRVLSGMCKSGLLQRIKNGVFKIGAGRKSNVLIDDSQISLF